MGKQLPDELVEVLDLIGIEWPQIDEDEIKASAKDYRHLAEGIRDAIKEGNNACSNIVAGKSKGKTVTAIDKRWGKLTTKDLTTFAKGCDDLAGALDDCADLIVGCKIAVITELSTTAAAATAGVIGMFFTVGLSGLLSAAAIAAARIAIHEAIDYAIDEITTIVSEKIEAKILSEIEELFTDRLGSDDDADVKDAGSALMAQDLVIEFDEFDKASGDYKKTAKNFDGKKGSFKEGGGKRRSSLKKDSRFAKLGTAMDKAEDAVEKKSDEMVKTLEDHGGKIDKSKRSHEEHEKRRKREFEKCGDGKEVPMYLLDADGSVLELHTDGSTNKVRANDNSGIRDLMTEPGQPGEVGRVWTRKGRKGNPYPISPGKETRKVTSTRVEAGSTDLSRATQIARYHNKDWGGGNYAAGRYVGEDKELIIVGNSEGPHSERNIGYPLLKAGKQDNLQELYTERQPCQGAGSWCDKWTAKYFGEDLEVTHSQKYLNSEDKKTRDAEHEAYREQLEKDHKKGGVRGGFR
ncbi:nucleic acid/nucleotide deaminase domain-containing protein [Streptomyces sp. CA-135486]|uniref:WXG100-like domain-containing protein n=1 Tax=Streptomyces sp. CA-135486 TaxID=3240049 RepID=UPI003D89D30F